MGTSAGVCHTHHLGDPRGLAASTQMNREHFIGLNRELLIPPLDRKRTQEQLTWIRVKRYVAGAVRGSLLLPTHSLQSF